MAEMSLSVLPPISSPVTIIPGNIANDKNLKYKKLCHSLGITEILLGIVSLLLSIGTLVSIEQSKLWNSNITHMAAGVWCGIVLSISGTFGILWRNKHSKTLLNANLSMSVVAAIFMGLQFVVSLIACLSSDGNNTLMTLHAFLAIVAFTALVICVLHSSYTCATKCCFPWLSTGRVIYHGLPGQYIQLDNGQTLLLQDHPFRIASSSRNPNDDFQKGRDDSGLPPVYSEQP